MLCTTTGNNVFSEASGEADENKVIFYEKTLFSMKKPQKIILFLVARWVIFYEKTLFSMKKPQKIILFPVASARPLKITLYFFASNNYIFDGLDGATKIKTIF
jgi:hypothetical protein